MLKGSSICTPISSIPSNRNAIKPVAGIMARPQDFHSVKGMDANQMTRKREVCLWHQLRTQPLGSMHL